MITSLKKSVLIFLTFLLLFGSMGLTNSLGAIGINNGPNSNSSLSSSVPNKNDSNNQTNSKSDIIQGSKATSSDYSNNIQLQSTSSTGSLTGQKAFSKQGEGNNTLLKTNESFNLQQTNSTLNNLNFNQSISTSYQSIPNYSNFDLTSGYYNISNIQSAPGIYTLEGSNKYSTITTNSYSSIASSFVIKDGAINITTLSVFLDETGVGGKVYLSISVVGINTTTHTPNGTVFFQQSGITVTTTPSWFNASISSPYNTFYKGTYALVVSLTNTASKVCNYNVVYDNATGDNNNESFMWVKPVNQNWNANEFNADLPFFYNYTVVDSSNLSQVKTITNPETVDLKINNVPVNLTDNYDSLNTFNFTSNSSVRFDVNYFLNYNSILPLKVNTNYNISNYNNYWNATFNVSAISTLQNHLFLRNFTLYNIPLSWDYTNETTVNSVQYSPYVINFNKIQSKLSFLDLNPSTSGTFQVVFRSNNNVTSIGLVDSNLNFYSNYSLTPKDSFHYVGIMSSNPDFGDQGYFTLENSTYQFFNVTLPSNIENWYFFPLRQISDYVNINTSFQGSYLLKFFWQNNNSTEIGYFERTIYFVLEPRVTVQNILTNDSYYVGEHVSPIVSVVDYFNGTPYSTALVNFSSDWNLNSELLFNSSNKLFEGSFSTINTSNGYHLVTLSVQGPFMDNKTITFTIFVNHYRPSSLDLINSSGFGPNNVTQLSSKINIRYNYTNLLNSTFINYPNVTYLLNNELVNPKSNEDGLNATVSNFINVSLNLDPETTDIRTGSYNLTVIAEKFGFQNQVKSFIFTVLGYNLNITLSSNLNFIPNQNYNIKAQMSFITQNTYLTNSKISSYDTTPLVPNTMYLANLNINLKVSVTFNNNTKKIYSLSDLTDSNGVANFELTSRQTKDLLSINELSASFNGNEYNNQISSDKKVNITSATLTSTNSSDSFGFVTLVMYLAIILSLLFIAAGGFYIFTAYVKKTSEQEKEFGEKIQVLTSFLGMYITNKDGLPIFLKSNQQLEDQNKHLMLSGVTYSIDLFLNNFKDEYMRNIIKDDNISRTTNTGLVNMTVIDQDKFKIIIGVSDSYRLYVLAREANSHTIRIFQKTLENIEGNIHLNNRIINLKQIYPLFTGEIQKVFPIELVNEFEIKFPELVEVITNPVKQLSLSSSTITKLKEFSFYLIKNSNLSSLHLDENLDFGTIINNSTKIKVDSLTLSKLLEILVRINSSKKDMYEILFICSQYKFSIFKNITPMTLPDDPSSQE